VNRPGVSGDFGRLVEGGVVQGWKAALAELALIYADRVNANL
jgi:putative transposase